MAGQGISLADVKLRPRRLAATLLGCVFLALCAYGVWNDFLPDPWVSWSALAVAAPVGVGVTGWLVWRLRRREIESDVVGDPVFLLASPLLAALLVMWLWIALAWGIAGGVTRLAGVAVSRTPVTLHAETYYSHYQCSLQLRGSALGGFIPRHLCVSIAYYRAHHDHRVKVVLYGWQGRLGLYISGFHHLHDLGPYKR